MMVILIKLQHLREAATSGYDSQSKLQSIPSTQLHVSLVLLMHVDCSVYPSTNSPRNFFQMSLDSCKLIPLQTVGDGNCLYRSFSYTCGF